jgi:SPP1 gp7 family putative phage head morphogenesis protein
MAEKNHLGLPEDRASQIVRAALEQASREMELLAQRYLAQGNGEQARRALEQMSAALDDLARQYALKVVEGPWGRLLVNAATLGANSLEGASFTISKAQIDVALYNAGIKIKGLVAEGAAVVQEAVAGAMIRGESLQDISRVIEERVQVEGGLIDSARADMIARNELFSVYRQTSKAAADEERVTLFQMRGPMDKRTAAICRLHVGQVKTAAEWMKIRKLVFLYGLHYQCRHSFDPVRDAKSQSVVRFEEWGVQQRARLKAAA